MRYIYIKQVFILIMCVALAACGALRTFHDYARAGDTVNIPVGMQPDFSKDNITVTITPSSGPLIVINATDPAIRSVINFYPDPISNMIVSREIDEDLTPSAGLYASTTGFMSNMEKDWYQTTVFLDLPSSLPVGLTQIEISNGTVSHSATLDVIAGVGVANTFNADFNGELLLADVMLDSLARSSHATVKLSSATIPSAVEITFTHDPDNTVGGTGRAFVVNPLGYRKNLHWSDDGINMTIILMESKDGIIDHMKDYKFYITGTATNLMEGAITGYDINGNVIPGVTLSVTNNF